MLDAFQKSGLAGFRGTGNGGGKSSARKRSRKSVSAACTNTIPALLPVEGDIPYFNGLFLGILQTHMEAYMTVEALLPATIGDDVETEERIKKAEKRLSAERLFGETLAATEHYLRLAYRGKDQAVVSVIASAGAPFVFLWLMSLGLLDDFVDGLLRGTPLLQRLNERDGDGNIVFMPTMEGEDAGLIHRGFEEE